MTAAFVASVTCAEPPESRKARKVSSVPNAQLPEVGAAGVLEQPGELGRGLARLEAQPCARSIRQCPVVRMSCQESTGPATAPVVQSNSTVDAR